MESEYSVTTHKEGEKITRKYTGFINRDGERMPFDNPTFPEVDEIEAQHDELMKNHPERKTITTIIIEE